MVSKILQFFLSFLLCSYLKTLFNDTLDGSLSLTLLVANGMHGREYLLHWFTGPTFILTVSRLVFVSQISAILTHFHTRYSIQTHVSIQQTILLHMYSIITTMKCCIAPCLIINSLSSLLKGFHTFPIERIPLEGIICDPKLHYWFPEGNIL